MITPAAAKTTAASRTTLHRRGGASGFASGYPLPPRNPPRRRGACRGTTAVRQPLLQLVEQAQAAQVEIPWPRDSISASGIEPRRLAYVPLDDWSKPATSLVQELQLPPLVGVDLAHKRKDQIPLIELPPTDGR